MRDIGIDGTWWNKFWKPAIPSQVKIYNWRAFHKALPAITHHARHGVKVVQTCSWCSEAVEDQDTIHVLWFVWGDNWGSSIFAKTLTLQQVRLPLLLDLNGNVCL